MLLLTRRSNESIVIGNNEVNITILGIQGNQVRLGIAAIKSIPIHRKEIFLKLEREGQGFSTIWSNSIANSIYPHQ